VGYQGREPWGAGPGVRRRAVRRLDNYLCTGGGRKPPNRRESEIMLAIVVLLFVIAGLAAIYPG
jgi:hypothetical protein